MRIDQDEFGARLQALVQATTVVQLRTMTMDLLAEFGLDRAYFLTRLSPDPRVGRILGNAGFSRVWERQYRARLRLVDPLPSIALRTTGAFVWPEGLKPGDVDAKGKRYLTIAAKYGLGRGIATACYGPQGRVGFIAAALAEDALAPNDLFIVRFGMVGQMSFQNYCKLVRVEEELQPLSNRELEVLELISRGKSNSVIAELLGISSSSVDVYVRRIFAKLGVADRTTASVKALSLGIIVAGT